MASPVARALLHELSERRLVADGIEVGVLGSERAEPLRPVDREPEVLDRLGRPPGEALAAREVVHREGVLGMGFDRVASPIGRLRVLALLVEVLERKPDLPAVGLVRLPRRGADRDERRPRLLGERGALHTGAGEDERAGGRIHALAVELERRPAPLDEVELLLQVLLLRLVVLVDEPVARLAGGERVDAEGGDAQLVPDGPPGTAPVADLVDLVDVRDCVLAHETSWSRQAASSASIVAVATIPSTRRASFGSRVTNASAWSCVSATYSAS